MPELPELQVVCEVLKRRVVGKTIARAELVQPTAAIVMRDLTGRGIAALEGATIQDAARRAKFIVLTLTAPNISARGAEPLELIINPKLTGRLQLATAADKRYKKTALVLALADGTELRYFDDRAMGQVYLTADRSRVPEFAGMGPEPLEIGREEFRARLKSFRGEIKGILTRGEFLAGIGNAYADEILWAARIHPYRKRTQLTAAEADALYDAIQNTLRDAIEQVRAEMGERIQNEPRDFFQVHLRTGELCPRCGTAISAVTANQRITNFCRTCQPGGLIRGM